MVSTYKVEEVGLFQIVRKPQQEPCGRRSGLPDRRHQNGQRHPQRRYHHPRIEPCEQPLPGFRDAKPVVFASIYPVAADEYEELAVAGEAQAQRRIADL
jgi:GTP-binding protein LepA